MVDHLDGVATDPSVGTRREGDDVAVSVAVTIDQAQEFDALAAGVAATKEAFAAAGVGTAIQQPRPRRMAHRHREGQARRL